MKKQLKSLNSARSARSARGYVWRRENPEKYKALLQRDFVKKKAKTEKQKKGKAEEY